jgi:replicative superfamily II helicase
MFDEDRFRTYLQDRKTPANTMAQFIRLTNEFFDYLQKYRQTSIDTQQAEDLHAFFTWLDQQVRRPRINRYFYALKAYYGFLADQDLYHAANEILGIISLEALKLKHFADVEPTVAKTLAAHNIRTAAQLLAITKTKAERKKLSEESNIPEETILELVKLSNLARIPGLKQKRARLFYDAGLDTLDKIAANNDPEDLVALFAQYVERTHFDGRAVSPAEAQFTLGMAQYLKPITEF